MLRAWQQFSWDWATQQRRVSVAASWGCGGRGHGNLRLCAHKRRWARAHHAPSPGQDPRLYLRRLQKKKTSRGLLAPSALRNLHRSGCKTHGWLRFCTPVGSDSSLLCNCGGGMACQMQSTREQWKRHSLSFRFPLEAVDRFQNTFWVKFCKGFHVRFGSVAITKVNGAFVTLRFKTPASAVKAPP